MSRLFLITALAGGLFAATAHAQDATPAVDGNMVTTTETQPLRWMGLPAFETLDTDGSGMVGTAEITAEITGAIMARIESRVGAMVERLDTDGDGALSPEEYAATNRWTRAYRWGAMDRPGNQGPLAHNDRQMRGEGHMMRGWHHRHGWAHGYHYGWDQAPRSQERPYRWRDEGWRDRSSAD